MTKKITIFGIFIALMTIGGYILYLVTRLIPIPGINFIVMGPYLTFMMMLILNRYPKFGTMSIINFVFGALMIIFNPWMMIAIVISGFISDLVMLLPIWGKVKQVLTMGIYNGISLLTSVYITQYITGNTLHKILDFKIIAIILVIAVTAGALGGYASLKMDNIYLRKAI